MHAERIMIADSDCLQAVRSSDAARTMTLYLTYQPCHFSGGHQRPSHISCTQELIRYKRNELQAHNVTLEVKIAYIYRAFWDLDKSDVKYWRMIENAKSGMRLLREDGVGLKAFDEDDWAFVTQCCGRDVQERLRNLEDLEVGYRQICDAFNHKFIGSI